MKMKNTVLTLSAAVILLWVVLGTWRSAGNDLMQKIERSYRAYYLSHPGDGSEAPPLVRWDFAQDTLVAIPPGEEQEITGTGGMRASVVSEPEQELSLTAIGIALARIPGVLFHGAFIAILLLLAAIFSGLRISKGGHNG